MTTQTEEQQSLNHLFPNAMYVSGMTGTIGSQGAVLVFQDGAIFGVDMGLGLGTQAQLLYNGQYELAPDHQHIRGRIHMMLPAGTHTITGVVNPERPSYLDIPFELPVTIDPDAVYPTRTESGPINLKFKKLRDLPYEHI